MRDSVLGAAGAASQGRIRHSGSPFVWILSLSLLLFMAQPWSPSISGLPIQVVLVWGVFAWASVFRGRALRSALSIFSMVQWLMIALIAGSILARSMLDGGDMVRFGQFVTGVMIALLGAVVSRSVPARTTVLAVMSLGAAISCGVAILQYFDLGLWLWRATEYMNVGYIYGSAGLETDPVAFVYSIVGVGVLLVGSWLLRWRWHIDVVPLSSAIVFACSLIVIAGLVVSNSRSGLLGLVLGIMVVMVWGWRARTQRSSLADVGRTPSVSARALRRLLVWHLLAAAVVGIIVYAVTARGAVLTDDPRWSTTWRAYLPLVWRHPLGLPAGIEIVEAMEQAGTGKYVPALDRGGGRPIPPHNLLLSMGVHYGPLAALGLLVLYGSALRRGSRVFSLLRCSGHRAAALWVLVVVAANVAVIAHSWFHNASIAMGEMRNWLWLGLLLQGAEQVEL